MIDRMPVIRSETEFDVNVVDSEQSGPAGLSYRSYYLPSDYAAPIAPDIRKVARNLEPWPKYCGIERELFRSRPGGQRYGLVLAGH